MNALMNAASLAHVGRGFSSPVHDSQQVFRCLLDATARPGTLQRLPLHTLQNLEPPSIDPALCAVLLTLLDADTSLHMDTLGDASLQPYLNFHTGVRWADGAGDAEFVALPATGLDADTWDRLAQGSDEAPQAGATLIVPVMQLGEQGGVAMRLAGPGIEHEHRLAVDGLALPFWQGREALQVDFPRGVDLILTCGDIVVALPRTTRVQLEG